MREGACEDRNEGNVCEREDKNEGNDTMVVKSLMSVLMLLFFKCYRCYYFCCYRVFLQLLLCLPKGVKRSCGFCDEFGNHEHQNHHLFQSSQPSL